MAPSLLVWIYTGGEDGSPEAARRGEQLAYAGDDVMDDVLGKGIINSVDRGDVVVEFGMDGSKEQRSRTAGHVYVLAPRKRAAAAAAAEAPKKQGIFPVSCASLVNCCQLRHKGPLCHLNFATGRAGTPIVIWLSTF